MNERHKEILCLSSAVFLELVKREGDMELRGNSRGTFSPDHPIFGKSVSIVYLADALRLEVLPALDDGGAK